VAIIPLGLLVVMGGAAAIVVVAIVGHKATTEKGDLGHLAAPTPKAEPSASYTPMGVDQLIDEWKENPVAAAKKYRFDGVELTGTLKEIGSNIHHQTWIDVRGEKDRGTHIFVISAKALDGLAKCKVGSAVVVRARADGSTMNLPWLVADEVSPQPAQKPDPSGNRPDAGAEQPPPAPKSEKPTEKAPDLVVIFQHSPKKSVAKLVKRGSPIPPGWQGGAGRILSLEYGQREIQLSAALAGGKEGATSSITSLR
jgi:hypothetical protein